MTGTADDARLLTQRYTSALERPHPPRPDAVPLAPSPLEAPAARLARSERRSGSRQRCAIVGSTVECSASNPTVTPRPATADCALLLEHLADRHDLDRHVLEREGGDLLVLGEDVLGGPLGVVGERRGLAGGQQRRAARRRRWATIATLMPGGLEVACGRRR